MRTILIDRATDVQALSRRLAGRGKAERVAESLRRLNPHADLDDLRPGTVLLVEDDAPVDHEATGTADMAALSQVASQLLPVLETALQSALERLEESGRERTEVADAMRLSAAKRAIGDDPELKKRAEAFSQGLKAAHARDGAATKALRELGGSARAEIERLARLAR